MNMKSNKGNNGKNGNHEYKELLEIQDISQHGDDFWYDYWVHNHDPFKEATIPTDALMTYKGRHQIKNWKTLVDLFENIRDPADLVLLLLQLKMEKRFDEFIHYNYDIENGNLSHEQIEKMVTLSNKMEDLDYYKILLFLFDLPENTALNGIIILSYLDLIDEYFEDIDDFLFMTLFRKQKNNIIKHLILAELPQSPQMRNKMLLLALDYENLDLIDFLIDLGAQLDLYEDLDNKNRDEDSDKDTDDKAQVDEDFDEDLTTGVPSDVSYELLKYILSKNAISKEALVVLAYEQHGHPAEQLITDHIRKYYSRDPDIMKAAYYMPLLNVDRYPRTGRPLAFMTTLPACRGLRLLKNTDLKSLKSSIGEFLSVPIKKTLIRSKSLENVSEVLQRPNVYMLKEFKKYLPVARYEGLYHEATPKKYCGTFYYFEPDSDVFLELGKCLIAANKYHALLLLESEYHNAYFDEISYMEMQNKMVTLIRMRGILEYMNKLTKEASESFQLLEDLKKTAYHKYASKLDLKSIPMKHKIESYDQAHQLVEILSKVISENDEDQKSEISQLYNRTDGKEYNFLYQTPEGEYLGHLVYALFDYADQGLCLIAEKLGYDTIILQREPGETRVVSEVLDVRPRDISYQSLCRGVQIPNYGSLGHPTLWFPEFNIIH